MNTTSKNPPSSEPEGYATAHDAYSELESLREELGSQKELYVHLAADFENLKRRSRLESEARAAAQKDSFIQELLPVIDNLERALSSGSAASSQQFRQGVEMTLQQLRLLLSANGVESRDAVGQPFDPHQHEAIAQHHNPAQPDQAILEILQRGYHKGGKLLRAAKVVVNDLKHFTQGQRGR